MSIWVISALLEERKIRGGFHYFYCSYPAESTLLWESTTAFALWIQRTMNFPPTEGCVRILNNFACALSYSSAILYRGRVVEVSSTSSIWPQGIFLQPPMMTGPKRTWLDLTRWVHGHFHMTEWHEEPFLTYNLRCVADIEKMEVVPHNETLETQLWKTPATCDSSKLSSDELA